MQQFGPVVASWKGGQNEGEDMIRDEILVGLNIIYFYLLKNIYLAVLGLSCGMQLLAVYVCVQPFLSCPTL